MAPTQKPENIDRRVIRQWDGSKTQDSKPGVNTPASTVNRQQNAGIIPAQNGQNGIGGFGSNNTIPANDFNNEMSPERKNAWIQEQESLNLVGAASNVLLGDLNQGGTPTGAANSASIDPAHDDLLARLKTQFGGGLA